MTRVLRLTHSADASSQNPRGIEPKRSGPPLHERTGSVDSGLGGSDFPLT